MKSICMVVYSYYPWDPRVRKEAESLARNGYSVDIICLRNKDERKIENINGVNVYRLNLKTKRGSKIRYAYQYGMFFLMSFFKLNSLDMKNKYNVIHIHTLPDYLVFITFLQKLKGKKIVLDFHESMPEMYLSRFSNKSIAKIMGFLERISGNYADRIITVSETLKNIFIKRGIRKNITIIMNAPDENIDEISSVRPPNLKNKFILNYSGGLMKERGLDIAIQAVNLLKNKIPEIYLMIFGSGGEEENLKSLVKELGLEKHVYFGGMISHKDVMKFTKIANVGLIPWRSNPITEVGTPNKLFECISMSVPVIAANTRALVDLMGDNVIFFKAGDFKDLAEKILFAYKNKVRLKIIGKKGNKIYQKINWNIMEKRLHELYRSLNR